MKSFIQDYENWLFAVGMIISGIGCFVFMRYLKKDNTEDISIFDKSVWFNIYLLGIGGILGGIFVLYREISKLL
jgi:putative Mn2+ efflux pump MntP